MTTYYLFDSYGFLCGETEDGNTRSTSTKPPQPNGALQPCWTGFEWVLLDKEQYLKPPTPTMAVPSSVTMRQARLALLQTGLLSQVNTTIANMPSPAGDAARIEWEFSSVVERNRPLVQSLVGALGITDAQLDDLFILAATL